MSVAAGFVALAIACGSPAHAPAAQMAVATDPALGKRVDAVIDNAIEAGREPIGDRDAMMLGEKAIYQ